MNKLSIDIGYSSVKLSYKGECYKSPSAISRVRNALANINLGDVYELEGCKYRVGVDSIKEALTTRDYDWLEKYGVIFLHKSLDMLNIDISQDIEIVTGLSLLNFNKAKDFGMSLRRSVNNKHLTTGSVIKVKPQGLITTQYKQGLTILVNIGYNTVDVIILRNGVPDQSLSYATTSGINWIVKELQKILNAKYQISYNELQINEILLSGSIFIGGVEKELHDTIEELKLIYSEMLLAELKGQDVQLWQTANYIVFSGGGINYLTKPQQANIIIDSNGEYADVLSY